MKAIGMLTYILLSNKIICTVVYRHTPLTDPNLCNKLLSQLKNLCNSSDTECRRRAISCLSSLATDVRNVSTLLSYNCLESLLDVANSVTDPVATAKAWTGLRHLGSDPNLILQHGLGGNADRKSSGMNQKLDYTIAMPKKGTSSSTATVCVDIAVTPAGMRAVRKARGLSSKKETGTNIAPSSSSTTLCKVYMEVRVLSSARGRVGIASASDGWNALSESNQSIGDDLLSWGVDGWRGKVYNNKAVQDASGSQQLQKQLWSEGKTIGFSVDTSNKLLEVYDCASGSSWAVSLNKDADVTVDWAVGVIFCASVVEGQGFTFNIGQEPLTCPAGAVSLIIY